MIVVKLASLSVTINAGQIAVKATLLDDKADYENF